MADSIRNTHRKTSHHSIETFKNGKIARTLVFIITFQMMFFGIPVPSSVMAADQTDPMLDLMGQYTPVVVTNGTSTQDSSSPEPQTTTIYPPIWDMNPLGEVVNTAPSAKDVTLVVNEDHAPVVVPFDASDPDGDTLTYEVMMMTDFYGSNAAHGTVTKNAAGQWVYDSDKNYSGTGYFMYRASDGEEYTGWKYVSVTVKPVNDAPVVPQTAMSWTLMENGQGAWKLEASDVDGDRLTYRALSASETRVREGETLATMPSLTVNADGNFSYLPPTNFSGIAVFAYVASDGELESAPRYVRIYVTAVNDAPVARDVTLRIQEDQKAVAVPFDATDPDGDELRYEIETGIHAHGQLLQDPYGKWLYKVDADYSGAAMFTYRACDAGKCSGWKYVAVTVSPVNDVPVASDVTLVIDEDQDPVAVPFAAVDPEGDALTYEIEAGSDAHGTVTQNADGVWMYDSDEDYAGTAQFMYRACDGSDCSQWKYVAVTIREVYDPPEVLVDELLSIDYFEETHPWYPQEPNDLKLLIDTEKLEMTFKGRKVVREMTPELLEGLLKGGVLTIHRTAEETRGEADMLTLIFDRSNADGLQLASLTQAYRADQYEVGGAVYPMDYKWIYGFDAATRKLSESTLITGTPDDGAYKGVTHLYDGYRRETVYEAWGDASLTDEGSVMAEARIKQERLYGDMEEGDLQIEVEYFREDGGFQAKRMIRRNEDGSITGRFIVVGAPDTQVLTDDIRYVPGYWEDTPMQAGQFYEITYGRRIDYVDGVAGVRYGLIVRYNLNGSAGVEVLDYPDETGLMIGSRAHSVRINEDGLFVLEASNRVPGARDITMVLDEDEDAVPVPFDASDPDGDMLTYEVQMDDGAHGSAIPDPDGVWFYKVDADYHGTAQFLYRACDGSTCSEWKYVAVTIRSVNDAPVVPQTAMYWTLREDMPGAWNLEASDVDGDTLTYRTLSAEVTRVRDDETLATVPSLTVNPDGSFTYLPATNFNGIAVFAYVASDGALESAPRYVRIYVTGENDAPVAKDVTLEINEDQDPVEVPFDGSDVDGDVLSIEVKTGDETHGLVKKENIVCIQAPCPERWTYEPEADFNGAAHFMYRAFDGKAYSAWKYVAVTINPMPEDATALIAELTAMADREEAEAAQSRERILVIRKAAEAVEARLSTAGQDLDAALEAIHALGHQDFIADIVAEAESLVSELKLNGETVREWVEFQYMLANNLGATAAAYEEHAGKLRVLIAGLEDGSLDPKTIEIPELLLPPQISPPYFEINPDEYLASLEAGLQRLDELWRLGRATIAVERHRQETLLNGIRTKAENLGAEAMGRFEALRLPKDPAELASIEEAESIARSMIAAINARYEEAAGRIWPEFAQEAAAVEAAVRAQVSRVVTVVRNSRNQNEYVIEREGLQVRVDMLLFLERLNQAMMESRNGAIAIEGDSPEAYANVLPGVDAEDVADLLSWGERDALESLDTCAVSGLIAGTQCIAFEHSASHALIEREKLVLRLIDKFWSDIREVHYADPVLSFEDDRMDGSHDIQVVTSDLEILEITLNADRFYEKLRGIEPPPGPPATLRDFLHRAFPGEEITLAGPSVGEGICRVSSCIRSLTIIRSEGIDTFLTKVRYKIVFAAGASYAVYEMLETEDLDTAVIEGTLTEETHLPLFPSQKYFSFETDLRPLDWNQGEARDTTMEVSAVRPDGIVEVLRHFMEEGEPVGLELKAGRSFAGTHFFETVRVNGKTPVEWLAEWDQPDETDILEIDNPSGIGDILQVDSFAESIVRTSTYLQIPPVFDFYRPSGTTIPSQAPSMDLTQARMTQTVYQSYMPTVAAPQMTATTYTSNVSSVKSFAVPYYSMPWYRPRKS